MPYIAIVDDEEDLREILEVHLSRKYEVKSFADGASFIKSLEQKLPDLVLLDIMMDNMNGYEVLSRIKERYPKLQVIFLSAKSQTFDKVLGLDLGADDYITKPFQKEELMARVKSHLRRFQEEPSSAGGSELYRYEKLCFNPQERNLTINDTRVDITRTEFMLLGLLSSVPGKVFTRDEILDHVWKDTIVSERTIDVHIRRLRKKLEQYSHLIKAHSGFGYSIERP